VDVGDADIPFARLQGLAQQPCVLERVVHDGGVSVFPQGEEVVILRDHLRRGAGEIEGVGLFRPAEVVELKDELLRQPLLAPPDHPADAGVDESEFMPGSGDGVNAGTAEVPHPVDGLGERRDHRSRCAVDVDWNVVSTLLLKLIQYLGNLRDGFVMAGVGASQDHKHADGILVNGLPHLRGVEAIMGLFGDREDLGLDLEIPRELFQRDLRVGSHDDVGFLGAETLVTAHLLPEPFLRETAKVNGFAAAGGGSSNRRLTLRYAP
jgi:hypothetical protein